MRIPLPLSSAPLPAPGIPPALPISCPPPHLLSLVFPVPLCHLLTPPTPHPISCPLFLSGVIFEQISIIYQLPRLFVGSFTLVLPYFPTGTAERVGGRVGGWVRSRAAGRAAGRPGAAPAEQGGVGGRAA